MKRKEIPADLSEAHEVFKSDLRKAYRKYVKAKKALGYCVVSNCVSRAGKDRAMCLGDAEKHRQGSKEYAAGVRAGLRVPNAGRVHCDVHGNWADICGCREEVR